MKLTAFEESILKGELGEAARKALEAVIAVGEALGADRLVEVHSAHISGISYTTIGDPGLRFFEKLVEQGARVSVPTTCNPIGFDTSDPYLLSPDEKYVEKQMKIISCLEKLGVKLTFTCTPYYIQCPPKGSHLAWGESSAVAYANTALEAWTNREGGPLALLAAIVGRTYYYGMHVPEQREPKVEVVVQAKLEGVTSYGALGAVVAEAVEGTIPLIKGVKPEHEELKALCASVGAYGDLPRVVVADHAKMKNVERRIEVKESDIKNVLDKHQWTGRAEAFWTGCPHASREKVIEILRIVERLGAPRTPVFVCTSRYVKESLKTIEEKLRKRNVYLVADTCMVVSTLRNAGFKVVATDSLKAAMYLPKLQGVEVEVIELRDYIKSTSAS